MLFLFLDAVVNIQDVLRQRLYLDMIPDSIRNSMYSLIPTLALLTSVPFVAIGGSILSFGYSITLILISLIGIIGVSFLIVAFKAMPKDILITDNKHNKT